MNYIDVLLGCIVLLGIRSGWQRGCLQSSIDLGRWIGALCLALFFYRHVSLALGDWYDWTGSARAPVAFLLSIVLAIGLTGYMERLVLVRIPYQAQRHRLNRVLGPIPGAMRGLVLAAILSPILLSLPLPTGASETVRESPIANLLAAQIDKMDVMLDPEIQEGINETLNNLLVRPESDQLVALPYTVQSPKPRPDLEADMLNLVNEERAAEGLKALVADTALRHVSRLHSTDMFNRGYFSHVTPDGLDPFDRLRRGGIAFRMAGENLALAPTLTIAHSGLMNSPGHRDNILRPQFAFVGIGIMDGGEHGLMVTQTFRN